MSITTLFLSRFFDEKTTNKLIGGKKVKYRNTNRFHSVNKISDTEYNIIIQGSSAGIGSGISRKNLEHNINIKTNITD